MLQSSTTVHCKTGTGSISSLFLLESIKALNDFSDLTIWKSPIINSKYLWTLDND